MKFKKNKTAFVTHNGQRYVMEYYFLVFFLFVWLLGQNRVDSSQDGRKLKNSKFQRKNP